MTPADITRIDQENLDPHDENRIRREHSINRPRMAFQYPPTEAQQPSGASARLMEESIASGRRGMVLKVLLDAQDALRYAAGPESLLHPDEEDAETLRQAANMLYPFVKRVKDRREQHDANRAEARRQIDEASQPPPPALTNVQMHDELNAVADAKRERIACDGCCGGKPMSDGVCFGIGMCPQVVQANQCVKFCNSVVEFAEQVNQESGLAAVAARLSEAPF